MGILKAALRSFSSAIVLPLALLYRVSGSRGLFAGQGQLLSLIPGKLGSYLRVAYYRATLRGCSPDSFIGFGSFFAHPEAEVGRGVYIGAYCVIGMASIGEDATIGSGVHILSGARQHGFKEIGTPIQEQKGEFRKVSIGRNCWIGDRAVIMADIGAQNVIGAGSVVAKKTGDYEVLAGNPARVVKKLTEGSSADAQESGPKQETRVGSV